MLYFLDLNGNYDEIFRYKLIELTDKYPTFGFGPYYSKIPLAGIAWQTKRVLRICRNMDLKKCSENTYEGLPRRINKHYL